MQAAAGIAARSPCGSTRVRWHRARTSEWEHPSLLGASPEAVPVPIPAAPFPIGFAQRSADTSRCVVRPWQSASHQLEHLSHGSVPVPRPAARCMDAVCLPQLPRGAHLQGKVPKHQLPQGSAQSTHSGAVSGKLRQREPSTRAEPTHPWDKSVAGFGSHHHSLQQI